MRARQIVGIALLCAAAVVAADLLMHSSLLRALRPQIVEPADGAIINGPVTVRWEGPQPMRATLTGNGQRVDLGLRQNPFEIDPSRFPRPGQYGVELRAPYLGRWIAVDRRFMVRRSRAAVAGAPLEAGEAPAPPPREAGNNAEMAELMAERDRLRVELAATQNELALLRDDKADSDDALADTQADAEARLAGLEAQREALGREHLAALQENQALHQRLDSIPPCLVWGYLAAPRPQTSPPSRQVVVSNRRGDVFRTEIQCVATRRADPGGLSPCVCVGSLWGD
jgi:hypothetical protein